MKSTIHTELGQIEYSEIGSGEPILFIHGGHSNADELLFQKGYDTSKYRLIMPSRPGYGNTPLAGFAQPREAADLIASLMNALEIEEAIVVGISAGGLTAISLAAYYPRRVKKLVLISAITQKWLNTDDKFYRRSKKLFAPEVEKRNWRLFRFFFNIFPQIMGKSIFKQLSTRKIGRIPKEELAEIREMIYKQSSDEGFMADINQEIEEGLLQKIECPTLILHSENDNSVSINMAKNANKKIPKSRLQIFDNKWGHLLWIGQESKEPIQAVMQFIDE